MSISMHHTRKKSKTISKDSLIKIIEDAKLFFEQAETCRRLDELQGSLLNYSSCIICIKHAMDLQEISEQPLTEEETKNTQFDVNHLNRSLKLCLTYYEKIKKKIESSGSRFQSGSSSEEENVECTNVKELLLKGKNCIFFENIIGNDIAIQNIQENILYPFEYPSIYPKRTKGILFYGPPGTGKTFLVKATVTELQNRNSQFQLLFYAPTGAELKGKYVGETEKKITSVFRCASNKAMECEHQSKRKTLSIVFFDEIDSIARNRSGDSSGISANATNTLLQMMDGVELIDNVIVMGATNYPWEIDEAILRRFDCKIYISLPDETTRSKLVKYYIIQFIKKCLQVTQKKKKEGDLKGEPPLAVTCPVSSCFEAWTEEEQPYHVYADFINLSELDIEIISKKHLGAKDERAAYSPADIEILINKVTKYSARHSAMKHGHFFSIDNASSVKKLNPFVAQLQQFYISKSLKQSIERKYPSLRFNKINIDVSDVLYGIYDHHAPYPDMEKTKVVDEKTYQEIIPQLIETEGFMIHKEYLELYFYDHDPEKYKLFVEFIETIPAEIDFFVKPLLQAQKPLPYKFYKKVTIRDKGSGNLHSLEVIFSGILDVIPQGAKQATTWFMFKRKEAYDTYLNFITGISLRIDKRESWVTIKHDKLNMLAIKSFLVTNDILLVDNITDGQLLSMFTKSPVTMYDVSPHLELLYIDVAPQSINIKEHVVHFDFSIQYFLKIFDKTSSDHSQATATKKNVKLLNQYHELGISPSPK